MDRLPADPTHPGEMLLEEFLKPMGLSQSAFAEHLHVSFRRINEIVNGRRSVTPETAWLFAQALGTTPQFWMKLQSNYDLARCRRRQTVRRVPALIP